MRYLKNEDGYSFIGVIVLLAITSLFALLSLQIRSNEYNETVRSHSNIQAYYIAESGANMIADYLIDKPDELPNLIGTSDSFKIDPVSPNYCVVTISEDDDYVYISSIGTVVKGKNFSKTAELQLKKSFGLNFSYALYVENNLNIKNNIDIVGDVAMKGTSDKYKQENSAEIIGALDFEVDYTMEMPAFPSYPSMGSTNSTEEPSSLSDDTYYSNGIKMDKEDITIHVYDDDFVVRLQYLSMTNKSSITVNRHGDGRVIMYVEDKNALLIDDSTINAGGDSEDIIIYYLSTGNSMDMKKGRVTADFFVKNAPKIDIGNNSEYNGQIVYDGNGEVIMENLGEWRQGLLFAPNASVDFKNNTEIHGVVIANDMMVQNNAILAFEAIENSFLLPGASNIIEKFLWRK